MAAPRRSSAAHVKSLVPRLECGYVREDRRGEGAIHSVRRQELGGVSPHRGVWGVFVGWRSVARSSGEPEYISLVRAASEGLGVLALACDLPQPKAWRVGRGRPEPGHRMLGPFGSRGHLRAGASA